MGIIWNIQQGLPGVARQPVEVVSVPAVWVPYSQVIDGTTFTVGPAGTRPAGLRGTDLRVRARCQFIVPRCDVLTVRALLSGYSVAHDRFIARVVEHAVSRKIILALDVMAKRHMQTPGVIMAYRREFVEELLKRDALLFNRAKTAYL